MSKENNAVSKICTPYMLQQAAKHFSQGFKLVGIDTDRPGMKETPLRYAKFLRQFTTVDEYEFKTFNKEVYDEMVIIKDIPFFSLCEHHMAPFFGVAHVAYVPNKAIVGLSKIPRTVDKFARRPSNQERVAQQIAEELTMKLKPKGVGVIIEARHLCVEMRGVKKHSCSTITSHMTGVFKSNGPCRTEFLSLIKK